jgi:aminoglycoside/choline kinase family phosphotransferase
MWTKDSSQIHSFLSEKCRLEKFEVLPLAGDASSRKYFRVILIEKERATAQVSLVRNQSVGSESKPKNQSVSTESKSVHSEKFVLMAWEPFQPEKYPFFSVLQHFKKHRVRVPEVIGFDEKLGLVLLEDLGDFTLEQAFYRAKKPADYKDYYDQAVAELIKIHFDSSKDHSPCTAFDLDFDIEKLSWELNFTKTNLFEKLLKHNFTEMETQLYTDAIYQMTRILHEQPKYIQHRDYHSRNLMIKEDKVRVIDFQDARMGAIQYDLVSLFKDSYVDFPADLENQYLKYYFGEARKRGYPVSSFDEFLIIYNLQAVQRCLKASGSFASFYVLRNDTRYLKYLQPTLLKVQSTLRHFAEFNEFANLIESTGAYHYQFNQFDS